MTYRTLKTAWKKLWPDSVAERDIEGSEPDDSVLIDEVVSMAKSIGLEVEVKTFIDFYKATKALR